MASDNGIRPGDVYEHRCENDQGYGIMVPVKTSSGWDLIDTYHLDPPTSRHGETSDSASVRRVIDLVNGEHDGYVSRVTSSFYHRNARCGAREVPHGLRLLLNLGDYDVVRRRECEDYDEADVVMDVPLYREQHFDWASGRTRGLCFVRKGAVKTPAREFHALCTHAWRELTLPNAGIADTLLDTALDKLRELREAGLATRADEARFFETVMVIQAIKKCQDEIDSACKWYRSQTEDEDDD